MLLTILGIIVFRFLEKNKIALVYFPLTAYWLVLFIATTIPGHDLPDVKMSDKIEHFGAYMVLAVLLCFTYSFQQKFNFLRKNPFIYTFATIFLYGGLDELHQLFIPGRSCDIRDLIADVSGALIGIGIVYLIKILSKKPLQDLTEN